MQGIDASMARALELANRPKDSVLPNPRVGAIIRYRGEVVAEGFHRGPGKAHAERDAILKAERQGFRNFHKSELITNLEPCVHTNKRTPPCCPLLLEKKFKKVFVATKDPNPNVSGKGIRFLKTKGIRVEIGTLREKAELLNQAYIKNQKLKQAYVIAKVAQSFDGKMALDNGESQWITSEKSRKQVHELRRRSQYIGVGKNTVERDDPKLNIRWGKYERPSRVLVFGKPKNLKTAQFCHLNEDFKIVQDRSSDMLSNLYADGVCEILLEGGPRTLSYWLQSGWVDQMHIFQGRGFLGGSGRYSLGFDWSLKSLDESVSFQPTYTTLLGPDIHFCGSFNVYRTR